MTKPNLQTIEANGLRFAYFEQGEGPLVICIHGFPDTPHTFSDLLPLLADAGFRAVAPYTRGYLPTSQPSDGDYSGLALGEDILALIEALGEDSATIVGHDWGALAAYTAANLAPERIKRMVTLAIPHPRVIKPGFATLRKAWHFLFLPTPFLAPWWMRRNDFAFVKYIYNWWAPGWNVSDEELKEVKESFGQPGGLQGPIGYYKAFARAPFSKRGREATRVSAKKTSVPTLAIYGREDGALQEEAFLHSPSAFTGEYELLALEKAGHFPHREEPDEVHAAILAFLKK